MLILFHILFYLSQCAQNCFNGEDCVYFRILEYKNQNIRIFDIDVLPDCLKHIAYCISLFVREFIYIHSTLRK